MTDQPPKCVHLESAMYFVGVIAMTVTKMDDSAGAQAGSDFVGRLRSETLRLRKIEDPQQPELGSVLHQWLDYFDHCVHRHVERSVDQSLEDLLDFNFGNSH